MPGLTMEGLEFTCSVRQSASQCFPLHSAIFSHCKKYTKKALQQSMLGCLLTSPLVMEHELYTVEIVLVNFIMRLLRTQSNFNTTYCSTDLMHTECPKPQGLQSLECPAGKPHELRTQSAKPIKSFSSSLSISSKQPNPVGVGVVVKRANYISVS